MSSQQDDTKVQVQGANNEKRQLDQQENIKSCNQEQQQNLIQKTYTQDLPQQNNFPENYENSQVTRDDLGNKPITFEQIQQVKNIKGIIGGKKRRKQYSNQPPNIEHTSCNRKVALQSMVAKGLWIFFHAFCLTVLIIVPETTLTSTLQPAWMLPLYSGFFLLNLIVYFGLWFADPGVQTERLSLNPQAYMQEKCQVRVYGHPPKGKDRQYDKENSVSFNFAKSQQTFTPAPLQRHQLSHSNPLQENHNYGNLNNASSYDDQMKEFYGQPKFPPSTDKTYTQNQPPLQGAPPTQAYLDRYQILQEYQKQVQQQYEGKDFTFLGSKHPAQGHSGYLDRRQGRPQGRYQQPPSSQENSVIMQSSIKDIYDQMESGFDLPSSKNYSYSQQFFNNEKSKQQQSHDRSKPFSEQNNTEPGAIATQKSTSQLLQQYNQDQQQNNNPSKQLQSQKQKFNNRIISQKQDSRKQLLEPQGSQGPKILLSDENFQGYQKPPIKSHMSGDFEGFITRGCMNHKQQVRGKSIAQSSIQFMGDVGKLMNPNVRLSVRNSGTFIGKERQSQYNEGQGPYKSVRQSQYRSQILKDLKRVKEDKYILGPDWWNSENPGKFCKYCKVWQPLRAKHCHECNRCVRKFDHHCEWIGNCVGEKNHPLFLFYLFVQSVVIVWSLYFAIRGLVPSSQNHVIWKIVFLSIAVSLIAVFGFFSVLLFFYHCMLAFTNQLSYERIKADKLEYIVDYPSEAWMFNEGCPSNCASFLCCNWNHSQHYLYKTNRILEPEVAELNECNCCQNQYFSCCN